MTPIIFTNTTAPYNQINQINQIQKSFDLKSPRYLDVGDSGMSVTIEPGCAYNGLYTSGVGPCIAIVLQYGEENAPTWINLAHVDGANFGDKSDIENYVSKTLALLAETKGKSFDRGRLSCSIFTGRLDNHTAPNMSMNRPEVLRQAFEAAGVHVCQAGFYENDILLVSVYGNGSVQVLRNTENDNYQKLLLTNQFMDETAWERLESHCDNIRGDDLTAIVFVDATRLFPAPDDARSKASGCGPGCQIF
jgi:hypothetical protein